MADQQPEPTLDLPAPLNVASARTFVSDALIRTLLVMDGKKKDRDIDNGWLRWHGFDAFYLEQKHMFIVAFSKPEMLVDSIISVYVMGQLVPMLKRLEPKEPGGYETVSTYLKSCIADNAEMLRSSLASKWPREYADILQRNAKPLFSMGAMSGL